MQQIRLLCNEFAHRSYLSAHLPTYERMDSLIITKVVEGLLANIFLRQQLFLVHI